MDQNTKLTYDNQIEFTRWAKRQGINKKNGAEIYFDYVTPVDATKYAQPDIPGFEADGRTTFGKALEILRKYFRISKAAMQSAQPKKQKAKQSANKKYAVTIKFTGRTGRKISQLVTYMAKEPFEAAYKARCWFTGFSGVGAASKLAEDPDVVYRVKERGLPRGEGVNIYKQAKFLRAGG